MSGGYSERPAVTDHGYVSYLEGNNAAAEAMRKRKRHQATCQGCDSCDTAAEARAEARGDL